MQNENRQNKKATSTVAEEQSTLGKVEIRPKQEREQFSHATDIVWGGMHQVVEY